MTAVNGLKDLFDKFEALAGDSAALWSFYADLSTDLKFIIWRQFPEYHETLRAEETEGRAMTFKTEDIAEVYAREQTIEDKEGQPPKPDAYKNEPSFWELLYIGGTEEDFANNRTEYIPYGFQKKKVGQKKRAVPAWALDNRFFLHVFGEAAMKRARVAYLYWRVGMTPSKIAEETKFSENFIRNVINKLRGKNATTQAHRASSVQVLLGGVNEAESRKTGEPTHKPSSVNPTQSPSSGFNEALNP